MRSINTQKCLLLYSGFISPRQRKMSIVAGTYQTNISQPQMNLAPPNKNKASIEVFIHKKKTDWFCPLYALKSVNRFDVN